MIVTFDFDDTLTRPIWDEKEGCFEPSEKPNYDTFAKLNDYHHQGHEIRIVTNRWNRLEIIDFIEQYKLPISAIHCTKGELKGETLLEIGSQLHFDDSPDEAVNNQQWKIPTIVVTYRYDQINNKEICEFIKIE